MKPLIILLSTFIITLLVQKLTRKSINYIFAGRIAMSIMLIFTALGHFIFTEGMIKMIPDFLPHKNHLVILTGILEIVISISLFSTNLRPIFGWILIVFLIVILPTNIKASMENLNYQTGSYNRNGLSYLWFRIPLQLLFIGWSYFFTIIKQ
ncbi:Uncharacterized membrane protein [Tenacibaculum sp. MAR_2009_124]|uniref:DoxX family protein n=1 Tax=Tenacibaculum sp. MAR_2009_124 TaxID=1250059 RepID=UPI000897EEA4|nr:hypothetical protein [Tenacibaculum sp. MAR_2009_124]SEC86229.1 Uncharacterized membrane protein [Tenacibaculum sp. MAR_2009_124]